MVNWRSVCCHSSLRDPLSLLYMSLTGPSCSNPQTQSSPLGVVRKHEVTFILDAGLCSRITKTVPFPRVVQFRRGGLQQLGYFPLVCQLLHKRYLERANQFIAGHLSLAKLLHYPGRGSRRIQDQKPQVASSQTFLESSDISTPEDKQHALFNS